MAYKIIQPYTYIIYTEAPGSLKVYFGADVFKRMDIIKQKQKDLMRFLR